MARRGSGRRGAGRRRRRRRGGGRATLADARRLARRRFGIPRLHPEQVRALEALFAGRDVLAVLPTGHGKSLIYQLFALLAGRPTVVVSPLIALMVDQEQSLRRRNAPVIRLDSSLRVAERKAALGRLREGGPLVVLTTPETLESEGAREAFREARPALLCVDEAHCISEWGHDFRPAYLRLAAERLALGEPQALALTATATPRVREDIAERLGLRDPLEVLAPPHRPNLRLEVELHSAATKDERLGNLIRKLKRPGIVYCSTTVAAGALGRAMERARIPSAHYHGRRTKAERELAQRRFMGGKRPLVMSATSAFGMGIDKPDIRFVVHYQAPGSLEQYVQEAGRAGRDGKPSRCVLLFDPDDLDIQRHLQRQGRAGASQVRRVAKALTAWAGEERPVVAADLALSAGVSQTITRSTCALLEGMGALRRDARKRYHLVVGKRELAGRTRELLERLDVREREDAGRLEALEAYAATRGCRSAFLRRYFGEARPPTCGRCDRCASTPNRTRRSRRRGRRRRRKPR